MDSGLDEIREVLGGMIEVSPEAISPDADLFTELGLDSLGLFNLIVAIEERRGVRFPEEHLHTVSTVQSLARCLDEIEPRRAALPHARDAVAGDACEPPWECP